jgi:hypothetical protein
MASNADFSAMKKLETDQQALLDLFVQLQNLGVETNTDPPQILMIGHQCAAKTLALEAITRII